MNLFNYRMEPTEAVNKLLETVDELPEASKYDLTFDVDNYQRYFKYESQGAEKIGVCRKCNSSIGRANSSTNGMMKHLKACDPDSHKLLKTRKSVSSTPNRAKQSNQLISSVFSVSSFLSRILYLFLERQEMGQEQCQHNATGQRFTQVYLRQSSATELR